MQSSWTVYIIETEDGLLYTGISTDPERRLLEHRQGARGARFFAGRTPRAIVHREPGLTRSNALRREYQIKSLSRAEKLALIEGCLPVCPDPATENSA